MASRMKRDYPTIPCEDCGRPAKAPNKRTKRCSTCRLARATAWHDGREAQCKCGAKYIAWHGVGDSRCGRCFIATSPAGGREAVEGTCAECKQPGVVFTDRISVCYPCLHDPKNKSWLPASVARKYRRLIDAKAARKPDHETQ